MISRLDRALVDLGLVRSRTQAQAAIREGRVRADGQLATKPAQLVDPERVELVEDQPWVSRAAHKLLGALDEAGVPIPARVLDAGASTGGFTQVLLAGGAQRVYAVDVGHGQLAPELRADPRVVVRERLNLRALTLADVDDQPVELVVADVSFISLTMLLAPLFGVLAPGGSALLLVKPQFEVGRSGLDDHGVVRTDELRTAAVDRVVAAAEALGATLRWRGASGLPGEAGNREFFLHLVTADVGGGG